MKPNRVVINRGGSEGQILYKNPDVYVEVSDLVVSDLLGEGSPRRSMALLEDEFHKWTFKNGIVSGPCRAEDNQVEEWFIQGPSAFVVADALGVQGTP